MVQRRELHRCRAPSRESWGPQRPERPSPRGRHITVQPSRHRSSCWLRGGRRRLPTAAGTAGYGAYCGGAGGGAVGGGATVTCGGAAGSDTSSWASSQSGRAWRSCYDTASMCYDEIQLEAISEKPTVGGISSRWPVTGDEESPEFLGITSAVVRIHQALLPQVISPLTRQGVRGVRVWRRQNQRSARLTHQSWCVR